MQKRECIKLDSGLPIREWKRSPKTNQSIFQIHHQRMTINEDQATREEE